MANPALEVDAALGRAWDELGAKIVAAGQEDASGYRRMLATLLARREFGRVAACLHISESEAEALRLSFVRDFGEVLNA